MKLTKFEHSHVVLEKNGKSLVIDPSALTKNFVVPENCVAVVVTHEHFDHLDESKLVQILNTYPEAKVYVNQSIANLCKEVPSRNIVVVNAGDSKTVEGFHLDFVGGKHEQVRPEIKRCENTGVIVDGLFYQPGDQHFVPEQKIKWLGVPLNAPWSKVSETNDFIKAINPEAVIPIHNGLLNEVGLQTYHAHIGAACEMVGAECHILAVGEQIDL